MNDLKLNNDTFESIKHINESFAICKMAKF